MLYPLDVLCIATHFSGEVKERIQREQQHSRWGMGGIGDGSVTKNIITIFENKHQWIWAHFFDANLRQEHWPDTAAYTSAMN